MSLSILILHGPNLNVLGIREPDIYGTKTLLEINADLQAVAAQHDVMLSCFQSNAEHELIDKIQSALGVVDCIVFNPAGFTHTSVALRDALLAVDIPFVEVHLSDPTQRESFRQHSYFSDIALDVVKGHGPAGYQLALQAAIGYCRRNSPGTDG